MEALIYFDCNASFGARPEKGLEERWSRDHLLEDMDLAGIAGALVRHTQALQYDYQHGNRRLLTEIAGCRDRLFPLWTIVPHQAGDFPGPADLLKEMADQDVRAVAMFPKTSGFPISPQVLSPLARALAANRILLLVPHPELTSWEQADRFLDIFDANPVLLADHSWASWRQVVALMDEHRNLRVEFSTFQANRAVEWFSERYGPERCLFGTGQPEKSPGAARAFLDFTLLDSSSARKVAGENLAHLLGTGPKASPSPSRWHDSITEATRRGLPVPVLTLDAHCHILHDAANGAGGPYVMVRGDAQGMIELTRRMGVRLTAVMSWNGTVGMDAAAGNLVTARAVDQFPQELIGLCSLNPTHQQPDEMEAQMKRYHLDLGFRGLKPYRRSPLPYNHPRFEPWWEFGDRHHLYGLFHTSVGGMAVVADIAGRHPNLHCLVAHVGGNYAFAAEVAQYMQKHPNLYAELTLTPVTNGVIEWLVRQVGPERVLFGTDAPMRDPRPQLGWVLYTRLSEHEKRLILGENFQRILRAGKLPQPLPTSIA
ncbi:MAG: amidohydrolase family protein [Planctomycetes bacterium]|nr:amidohydrolase family protein [Planctomycetota bacterium]